MRILSWNKKGLGILLVFIILSNTVSGYPTGPASPVLRTKPSKRNQRSTGIGSLGSQSDVMRLGLGFEDDGNKPDLKISEIAGVQTGKSEIYGKSGQIHEENMNPAQTKERRENRASDLENRIKKIVAEQLGVGVSEIKLDSNFVNELGADSLDTVELIMALEEEFDIEISDKDAERIKTVRDALNYINRHIGH